MRKARATMPCVSGYLLREWAINHLRKNISTTHLSSSVFVLQYYLSVLRCCRLSVCLSAFVAGIV